MKLAYPVGSTQSTLPVADPGPDPVEPEPFFLRIRIRYSGVSKQNFHLYKDMELYKNVTFYG
jgi:hypothetical protein